MNDAIRHERLRSLPSIDELLNRASLAELVARHPRPLVVKAFQQAVADVRAELLAGRSREFRDDDARIALARLSHSALRPVINATGVLLHTNLGRAPLSLRAINQVVSVARACNLEFDLDEGARGTRYAPLVDGLCELTHAEAALVVNNCAAAVLLTLSSLAQGREVVVSRGELVEIGGGFRVPDVMRQSGARLHEVGTTNRTRLADYASAIDHHTALVTKVHRSNFALVGFTEDTSVAQLATLTRERQVPLFVDLGSGSLRDLNAQGVPPEPTVASLIDAGADLVAFSADKLLGGPQAGIVVGRRSLVSQLEKHPLNRALRIDKLTVAALEATLASYREGLENVEIPLRVMARASAAEVRARAERAAALLTSNEIVHRVEASVAQLGGGSMPESRLPSFAIVLSSASPNELHDRLRRGAQCVVGRIANDDVWLDVRTITDEQVEPLVDAVTLAVKGGT